MELTFNMISPRFEVDSSTPWHGALPPIDKKVLVMLTRNEDDILIAKRVAEDSWLAVDGDSYPEYVNFKTDDIHSWGFLENAVEN